MTIQKRNQEILNAARQAAQRARPEAWDAVQKALGIYETPEEPDQARIRENVAARQARREAEWAKENKKAPKPRQATRDEERATLNRTPF